MNRAVHPLRRPGLRTHPAGGRTDRLRLFGLPPRILPGGATRFGRPERTGTVDIPGRRQRRGRHGAAAGRAGRHPLRAGLDRLVRFGRNPRHPHPLENREVV